ncbi:MAG: GNAT family N-acetyltransferase [Parvularculaceae bacterium]
MTYPHQIKTERIILRPVRLEQAAQFAADLNDLDIVKMTSSWGYPVTTKIVTERFNNSHRFDPDQKFNLAMEYNGKMVGLIGATRLSEPEDTWTIGYMSTKAVWGQGLMTEAIRGLCHHLFALHKVSYLIADVFIDNPASMRVLEKIGFVVKGEPEMVWAEARQANQQSQPYVLARERLIP